MRLVKGPNAREDKQISNCKMEQPKVKIQKRTAKGHVAKTH